MGSFKLNFSKDQDRRITGVNIIDDMLFFTDGFTEPKKINIKDFKAADHTSGTTSIYNREFKERDITVIRPHPVDVINISTTDKEEISINAKEPLVLTSTAIVNSNYVELAGQAIPNGEEFVKRGFYFLKTATRPTKDKLVAEGTLKDNVLQAATTFRTTIPNDADGEKVYYIAFATNGVGEKQFARELNAEDYDIEYFVMRNSDSETLSVDTNPAQKGNGNNYILKGTVTNDGNSDITDTFFLIKKVGILDTAATPSSLTETDSDTTKKVSSTFDPSTGEFRLSIVLTAGFKYFYQAVATNLDGEEDEGGIETIKVHSQGTQEVILKQFYSGPTSKTATAIAKYSVDNPYGVEERGFLFSDTIREKAAMIQAFNSGLNTVTKETVTTNASNFNNDFRFEYASNITKTASALAFMKLHGIAQVYYSDIITAEGQNLVLHINTSTVRQKGSFTGGDKKITMRGNVTNPTLANSVGFIIGKKPLSGSFGTEDTIEEKNNLIAALNSNPTEAIEVETASINDFTKEYTSSLELGQLGYGQKYYVMAIGYDLDNNRVLGGVARTSIKESTTVPNFYTLAVTGPSATNVTLNARLVKPPPPDPPSLYEIGFEYSTSSDFSSSTDVVASSSQLDDVNDYLTDSSTGDHTWNATIAQSSLTAGTTYFVRAYIERTSTSGRVYANGTETTNEFGPGIVYFVSKSAAVVGLPIPNIRVSGVQAKSAIFEIDTLNKKGSNLPLVDMSPTFYYMKKSEVPVASRGSAASIQAYIRINKESTASTVSGKILADYDGTDLAIRNDQANAQMNSSSSSLSPQVSYPALSPNTTYYVFSSATSESTLTNNGFATGEGTSVNVKEFTTKNNSTPPIIGNVLIDPSTIKPDQASASYTILSNGNDPTYFSSGFYYIKSSDFSGSTSQNLYDDSNATFLELTNHPYYKANITGLDNNTEYKIIAKLENSGGYALSPDITTFTTGYPVGNYNLNLDRTVVYLDSNGRGKSQSDPTPSGEATVGFEISPPDANLIIEIGKFDGLDDCEPIVSDVIINGQRKLAIMSGCKVSTRRRAAIVKIKHASNPQIFKELSVKQDHFNSVVYSDDDDGFSDGGDFL